MDTATQNPQEVNVDYDAIIAGGGFSGLGMLHALKQQGLSVKVFEAGEDIGGTWYWNCYPGARTDSESYYYCFSFSRELLQEWTWQERYPTQPEMQSYFNYVIDKFGLREHIQCATPVASAVFDQAQGCWRIATDGGEQVTARYFISAMGLLSEPYIPEIPRLNSFEGLCCHTARWPQEGIDFRGKRVGIIGAGASAVQLLPIAAESAEQLTLFQRTPNYIFPARNRQMSEADTDAIKDDYDNIWQTARGHPFGMPFVNSPANRLAVDTPPEQRQRIYEEYWRQGSFRFFFETFDDLLTDPQANETAAQFMRNKIREIVDDPETAEKLCPKTYPLFAKRPPADHGYYQAFNRDNVKLVDIAEQEPIETITARGVKTTAAEYEFDVLIMATGFAAFTGALKQVDIRGRGGLSLQEKWSQQVQTFGGLGTHGFPNLFIILGPQVPFGNGPVMIEDNIAWIADCIAHMENSGRRVAEVTPAAEQAWTEETDELLQYSLARHGAEVNSWFLGANVAGQKASALVYMGGSNNYFARCRESAQSGFPELEFYQAGPAPQDEQSSA